MNFREALLAKFVGQDMGQPLFMPDLRLWFKWHSRQGTLPDACRESSLAEITSTLNCPAWVVQTPWRLEHEGIDITREESGDQRAIQYHTGSGVLSEIWSLGPDGDWWQTEYPVKDEDDLDAAEEIVKAMQYRVDYSEPPEADTSPDVIEVVEIPRVAYSDMLHTLLGWSEGLMLMMGPEEDRLTALLDEMEAKRQELIQRLAGDLPQSVFLSPDNLDGQYISPAVFEEHFEESYRKTCGMLHPRDKYLLVHIGGISKHLLPLLAGCGVDGANGISGPPQSNAALPEARESAGPDMTLWGGIPQDYMNPVHDRSVLIKAVEKAKTFAESDNRTIIGVADHVPVNAEFSRLEEIAKRINGS